MKFKPGRKTTSTTLVGLMLLAMTAAPPALGWSLFGDDSEERAKVEAAAKAAAEAKAAEEMHVAEQERAAALAREDSARKAAEAKAAEQARQAEQVRAAALAREEAARKAAETKAREAAEAAAKAAREAAYARWQVAHPNAEVGLPGLLGRMATKQAEHLAKLARQRAAPKPDKYAELKQQSSAITQDQQATARNLFKSSFTLWQAGDFAAAEIGFKRGLVLDPANGLGNYYYADCLNRKGDKTGAYEYFSRAMTLAPNSVEGLKAEVALSDLPKPQDKDVEQVLPIPVQYTVADHPYELWDCPECPVMVVIPSGEFNMGSSASEPGRGRDESPLHRVTVASFALAKTEVTQGQWKVLMGDNPSQFTEYGDDCPVEQVTWDEAQAYVRKLSEKTGHKYRLPSESEWEYAARAGTTTAYWWGEQASYEYMNSGKELCCGGHASGNDLWVNSAPVARFQANPFGLHDMNGNVWEWVGDCYKNNYDGSPADGAAWSMRDCALRVKRGGSWGVAPADARSARRGGDAPARRSNNLGFRVARTLP